ncbi:MAG: NUDIX domain-containing protein [Eubacterium sp.]|nr:NUDIX domain-containing protein [Eubacterium sp.]
MSIDMTTPCDNGFINIRVGAIIMKDNKILMAGCKERPEYLYSVGGRVKFGETSEEAVVREVLEETGHKLEVDRLGFIHENYFYGDTPHNNGKLIYEVSYYYYMKVPEDFEPKGMSFTEDGEDEFLCWIDLEDPIKYYPDFFRTELKEPIKSVKHFLNDER